MRRTDRLLSSKPDLEEIINSADSCHLALIDNGKPYIVTLNYGYEWEHELPCLYFHCAHDGRKIECLKANPLVCFTVSADHELVAGDAACSWGMRYRSIVGYGTVEFLSTDEDKKSGLDHIMNKYTGKSGFAYRAEDFGHTTVLRLRVTEMSGKRKR